MDVIEAIHGRRSIRAYRPSPIERALLEDVLWAAAQAPTPPVSGETPWAFCVIEGVDRIASYGARAKQYAREHQPDDSSWSWPNNPDFKVFWDAPALVLICGRIGKRRDGLRLLPRRPEPHVGRSRAGPWLLLGRCADSMVE